MSKIDVVIATKGERTFPYCIRAIKKSMSINNLILISTNDFIHKAEKVGDICIPFDEKNIGKARAEGLKYVETPIYASIDSDVQVTPEWFKWCLKAILPADVAATQGYAKTQGRYYADLEEQYIRKGGKYGKGWFCCLGNTLLKTEIIRKIGIPLIRVEEDLQLRLKVEAAGYRWISNINLICPHLKTDLNIWSHAVWWGSMGKNVDVVRCLARIPYYLTFGMLQRSIQENLFLEGLQVHLLYGKLKREIAKL